MTKGRMLAVAVAVVLAAASIHAYSPSRRTELTFNGPVALPGVTLAAGRYTFEIATADGNTVVLVKNQYGPVFMRFTEPVERPAGMPRNVAVRFGEVAAGGRAADSRVVPHW